MSRGLTPSVVLALALALLPPTAAAVDLLPSEVRFEGDEARVLVRSERGRVLVTTEPAEPVGGAAPGAEPEDLAPSPRELDAPHAWRGIDGIVEIVVRRSGSHAVDIVVEDGSRAGLWVEWPAEERNAPGPAGLALFAAALGAALLAQRRG